MTPPDIKGFKIAVEPIRRKEDIKAIAQLLENNPRNQLLFILWVNNGLRTVDLLNLKVGQVRNKKPWDIIYLIESKTKKTNILCINNSVYKALKRYFREYKPKNEQRLFFSRKTKTKPINSQTVSRLIKIWCRTINLKGNYWSHTLRKTWGYIQRTYYKVGFDVICKRYNHSSPAVTMRYLGIQSKEVYAILMNEV